MNERNKMKESASRTRRLTIIAQDPSVKDFKGKILKTSIDIPAEELAYGPRGYRVSIIDYDTSTARFYRSDTEYQDSTGERKEYIDPYKELADAGDDAALLNDPRFHCQNAYAIIMRTLARFEFALGRRVSWGFDGHQIHVAPHAFADANAFYAERERALCFGYFKGSGVTRPNNEIIFSCLSHDVVAHETTHALLDGLRERYTDPSSPDQAAFHEGFADIIALLSVFSLPDVVGSLLPQIEDAARRTRKRVVKGAKKKDVQYVTKKYLTEENLRNSVLFGLADEMGDELSGIRGSALRRSVELSQIEPKKRKRCYDDAEFQEPHRRGELLVAAVMMSFLQIWLKRIAKYTEQRKLNDKLDKSLIVDEGASAAEHLLTMMIRALDYAPPTDILFSDFLSAVLTADADVVPDDSKYCYRETLLKNFGSFGIEPADSAGEEGIWGSCLDKKFGYERTHFESLLRDPTEVFRFIWDNRDELFEKSGAEDKYSFEDAYTEVQSVRPSVRMAPDGFAVRETVASYFQILNLRVDEVVKFGIFLPRKMIEEIGYIDVRLYGGGNLIFDEYGRLKYHIENRIYNAKKQSQRLQYLWKTGYLTSQTFRENLFMRMHMQKALGTPMRGEEQF
jgi:hypothetical protein